MSRIDELDVDFILYGNPSFDDVLLFFRQGDFHEESYAIEAIEKYLQTEEQRTTLFENNLSIEKILNGRFAGKQEEIVNKIFEEWNKKLNFDYFKF